MAKAEQKNAANSIRQHSLIVATAGHVDHGKTSLVANITGVDTDSLAEEKARGLTINLGFAYHHFDASDSQGEQRFTLGFVDVPGHTDFINNMLAGVSSIDAALLIVAADDGIMPQTLEHLTILKLLGVSQAIVVITKIDRVAAEEVELLQEEIVELLQGSSMAGATVFQVSNTSGDGIAELKQELEKRVVAHCTRRMEQQRSQETAAPCRFLIDRAFSVTGIGTVVTGSVYSGEIHAGTELFHSGSESNTRIKALRQDQLSVDEASQQQRVAVNVSLSLEHCRRGDWLLEQALYHPVSRFDAAIEFLADSDEHSQHAINNTREYHLHIAASHCIAKIRTLDFASGLFQLNLDQRISTHWNDRFIIRDPQSQRTLGGGKVVDIFVPRRGRASEQRIEELRLGNLTSKEALLALVKQQKSGLNLTQFAINRSLGAKQVAKLLESVEGRAVELAFQDQHYPLLLHNAAYSESANAVLRELAEYHRQHGNQQGISEPLLSSAVKFTGSHYLFHAIVLKLIETGKIQRAGTLLHLPGHTISLSLEEKLFLEKIRPLLAKHGFVPPRTRELVEMTGIQLAALDNILRLTSKGGNLIKVADNRYYLPETIMELADFTEKLVSASGEDGNFSVIQFRDASKIGRNLCIEILEYFDRVGFTRRDGNNRFLRTEKENIFN